MPKPNPPAADEAAKADVQPEDVKTTAPLEPVAAAGEPPAPVPPVETGDERTETRTVLARNTSATMITLDDDDTPFLPGRKKWLTRTEADRLSRRKMIVILN